MTELLTIGAIIAGAFYIKYAREKNTMSIWALGILAGILVFLCEPLLAQITGMEYDGIGLIAEILGVVYIVWSVQAIRRL